LTGCNNGGKSDQSGQPGTRSKPIETEYQPPNPTDGHDAANKQADNNKENQKSDSTAEQPSIDSIGYLQPAGVVNDTKIINRVAEHLSYVAFFSYRVKS